MPPSPPPAPPPVKATVLAPGAGRSFSVRPGDRMTLKVAAAETGGAFALAEFTAPPGYAGPPPHRHRGTDEAFYVLEGEFALTVEGQTAPAGPGAFVYVPRGVLHTYANPGSVPARLLLVMSPAGFERYFDDLAAAYASGDPEPGRLAAVFARHGVEVPAGEVPAGEAPAGEAPAGAQREGV